MPDIRQPGAGRWSALLAVVLLGVAPLAATVLWPTVVAAQTDPRPGGPWDGSAYDQPEDTTEVIEVKTPSTPVAATLQLRKDRATAEILDATVEILDVEDDGFVPAEACASDPLVFPSDGTAATEATDTLRFAVDEFTFPCNGRWILRTTGRTNAEGVEPVVLDAEFLALSLPPAVTTMTTSADPATGEVRISWEQVPAGDLPVDALGYEVQRAGPQREDGSFGLFDRVDVVGLAARPSVVDDPDVAGTYRYRVRTVRNGPDGPVRSSIIDGDMRTVEVAEPPPTTTTAPPTTRPRPQVGAIPTTPPAPRIDLSPPTTADTGFGEILDYGDGFGQRPGPRIGSTTDELAGEQLGGASIITDEGDGSDRVAVFLPAAGALVLLGWAGHVIYFNKLADQLDGDEVPVTEPTAGT